MADYPFGMGGQVPVLEDSDGDHRYDKSTLFAEGLVFPTGILSDNAAIKPHVRRLAESRFSLDELWSNERLALMREQLQSASDLDFPTISGCWSGLAAVF